jgi:gliding motility-associated-like protein
MIQHKLFFLIFFCLGSLCLSSQEICDNGVDDDGDGLIDLQDPECNCNGIDIITPLSLFPNPSFEDNTCNPGFGRAHCAIGWVNPSEGSPDYYDRCDIPISTILPIAQCPVPHGDKFFGIADIRGNSLIHKEYVGTKLIAPMEAGEVYLLSFWIGYVLDPSDMFSSPSVDFAVYGNTDPNVIDVPFDSTLCPTSITSLVDTFGNIINPWSMVTRETIPNGGGQGWKQIRIEFTALENYAAILLGPSCDLPSGLNYYFLDNLVLSKRNSFNTDFIIVQSGKACEDNLVLEVPDMPGLNYQWYRNETAILGETSPVYNIPAIPFGNGSYKCLISNAFGCSVSDPFVVDETNRQIEFDAPLGVCPNNPEQIALLGSYDSYQWSNGLGQTPSINVSQPDIYSVTVVDSDGCVLTASYNLPRFADAQFLADPTKESTPGAADGSILINHEGGVGNPSITWWNGSNDNPLENLSQGIYCLTVTADERCPVADCIDLDLDIQPIVIVPTIEPVRCFEETNGSIRLQIAGGLEPLSLQWNGHPEWNGRRDLLDLAAGTYMLRLTDAEGTIVNQSYTVIQPEPLQATLSVTPLTCHNSADGSIWISDERGGNGGFNYFWDQNNIPGLSYLDNLAGGSHSLLVVDAKGCEYRTEANVPVPERISATIDIMHPYCLGVNDGSIHINGVTGGTPPFNFFANGSEVDSDIFDLAGEASYDLLILDNNNCEFRQSVFLANQIEFDLDIGKDLIIEEYFTANIRANGSEPIDSYRWTASSGLDKNCSDCSLIQLLIEESELVSLYAVSVDGCTATDSVLITMTPSKKIYIPNAFSPNNDGINDDFQIYHADEIELVQYFRVYDRNGVKLFDFEDVNRVDAMKFWNQRVNDLDLPSGIYVYIIKVVFKDQTAKQFKGDMSIIR